MADRTVRAIFEARVSGAQKGMRSLSKDVDGAGKKVDGLTKDLKTLSASKVTPTVDVKIDEAKKRLSALTRQLGDLKAMEPSATVDADIAEAKKKIAEVRGEIKELNASKAEVRVNAAVGDAQKRIKEITVQLGELRTMEVTPEVTANIKAAQKSLRDARSELRELNAAKAEMKVTADTRPAKAAIDDLADDVGEAGAEGGEEAGDGIVSGILSALQTIPIAGAVIGVGVAIAAGLLLGIKDGLAIEAERDIFSAQTGLDEDTSARFGRAAGEAYANAWGDSVAANLDTARLALQAGIIDSDATDAEIENVIAKLTGITDLFDYDVTMAVQAVGNAMKTGLVKDADQAFDLIQAASERVASDDLLETLNEYSNQFVTMGITGEQAFGLIVQGAEAGARDTDKVADSLKELGLRIREGLDPARDALKDLGLDVDDTIEAFTRGGPDAQRAIGDVFDALRDLEAKGGNTQAVIAALFGGPGEDLGAALYALDIDGVADALGGVDGAAGAAERALATMSDNASTKIEEAKRNVELAMDGIKGALAAAFGDDIAGASEWVSKNRAPLMQFMLDIVNGALDMGVAFAEFGATALDALADVTDAAANVLYWIVPGFDKSALEESADGMRTVADTLRTDVPAALEEVRTKANDWAAPELLKAKVHDATVAMGQDMETFSKVVEDAGGTIKINGEVVTAEQALAELQANINETDGTVTINGDKVPAEDALDVLMALVNASAGDVEVGADATPAELEHRRLLAMIGATDAAVTVSADTDAAERALKALEKTRYMTLGVRVAGVNGVGGLTKDAHDGGWTGLARGLHAGGKVPGIDPGYDNVLWPLNSGGRTMMQPLAGGEYVVNSKDSAYWAPVLEWMNGGGRPTQHTETTNTPITIGTLVSPDVKSFRREAERRREQAYDANRSAS